MGPCIVQDWVVSEERVQFGFAVDMGSRQDIPQCKQLGTKSSQLGTESNARTKAHERPAAGSGAKINIIAIICVSLSSSATLLSSFSSPS